MILAHFATKSTEKEVHKPLCCSKEVRLHQTANVVSYIKMFSSDNYSSILNLRQFFVLTSRFNSQHYHCSDKHASLHLILVV